MTHHKCVLFDLDGTLVDSLADLADSMNHVLTRQGLPPHPVQAYRYFVGDGITRLVQRARPTEARQQDLVQDCVQKMRQEYAGRAERKWRPSLAFRADRAVPLAGPHTVIKKHGTPKQ